MYGGFFSWGCCNSNAGQPTAEKIELQGAQEPIAEKSSANIPMATNSPKLENFPVEVDISEGVFGIYDLRVEDFGKVVKVRRLKQGPK